MQASDEMELHATPGECPSRADSRWNDDVSHREVGFSGGFVSMGEGDGEGNSAHDMGCSMGSDRAQAAEVGSYNEFTARGLGDYLVESGSTSASASASALSIGSSARSRGRNIDTSGNRTRPWTGCVRKRDVQYSQFEL